MMVLLFGLLACGEATEDVEPEEEAPKEEPAEKPDKPSKPAKKGKPTVVDCNATASSLGGKAGDQMLVKCPADCTSGSVWGDGRYTPDSKICTAAIHTGAIDASGGKAMVMFKGKMGDFKGSKKNGIESRPWTTEYEPTVVIKGKKK